MHKFGIKVSKSISGTLPAFVPGKLPMFSVDERPCSDFEVLNGVPRQQSAHTRAMDPDLQEHSASDASLVPTDASHRPSSGGSEHGQTGDLGSGATETGTSEPRAFAASRSRARPQLITEEDGVELPVPGLDSYPGNDRKS